MFDVKSRYGSSIPVLIATKAGVFDVAGNLLDPTPTKALASIEGAWWSLGSDGEIRRNGQPVAASPAGVTLNCLLPTQSGLWIGADQARLFRLEDGSVAEDQAFANAPGRDEWHTPWGGPPDVRSLAEDEAGILYVNVHVGGILRREAGGFVPTLDINADVHQVSTYRSAVMAACAWGLAVSTDGGVSWEFRSDGLHANYCRAATAIGDTILVSASTGPGGRRAALYRGPFAGGPLDRCREGLPEWFSTNLDTGCIAVDGDSVWVGDRNGTLYCSGDAGTSWSVALSELPAITALGASG